MADKHSIEEIMSELSKKHHLPSDEQDGDAFDIRFAPKGEAVKEVFGKSDEVRGHDSSVQRTVKAYDDSSSERSAVRSVSSKKLSEGSEKTAAEERTPVREKPVIPVISESAPDEKRAVDNARRISELSKHSGRDKRKGEPADEPVRRTSIKDVELGLENKLIEDTVEVLKHETASSSADEEYFSKSAQVSEQRRKKVEDLAELLQLNGIKKDLMKLHRKRYHTVSVSLRTTMMHRRYSVT